MGSPATGVLRQGGVRWVRPAQQWGRQEPKSPFLLPSVIERVWSKSFPMWAEVILKLGWGCYEPSVSQDGQGGP